MMYYRSVSRERPDIDNFGVWVFGTAGPRGLRLFRKEMDAMMLQRFIAIVYEDRERNKVEILKSEDYRSISDPVIR